MLVNSECTWEDWSAPSWGVRGDGVHYEEFRVEKNALGKKKKIKKKEKAHSRGRYSALKEWWCTAAGYGWKMVYYKGHRVLFETEASVAAGQKVN